MHTSFELDNDVFNINDLENIIGKHNHDDKKHDIYIVLNKIKIYD